MRKITQVGVVVGASVLSIFAQPGVGTYKGKVIVSKEQVLDRIKTIGLNDKPLDQTFLPVLVSMTEEAVIKLKVENSGIADSEDFKKAAHAQAEEFKRVYFLQKEAKKKITSDMRKSVYQDMKNAIESKKEFKPSIIVCKDESTAKTAIEKLNKGQCFEEVAKLYSLDPVTRQNGGLSSDFVSEDAYAPEISSVLSSLKEGEVSSPVRTNANGGVVYLVLKIGSGNRRAQIMPSMDSPAVASRIEQILVNNLVQEVLMDIAKDMEVYDLNDQKLARNKS